MAIDDRLRRRAILIEPGRGHRALDLADGVLAVGDARLELVDLRAPCPIDARPPARLGVGTFFRPAIVFDLRGYSMMVSTFFTFSRGPTFFTALGPHPQRSWLRAAAR